MEAQATKPIQSENHREDLNLTYICSLKNILLHFFLSFYWCLSEA